MHSSSIPISAAEEHFGGDGWNKADSAGQKKKARKFRLHSPTSHVKTSTSVVTGGCPRLKLRPRLSCFPSGVDFKIKLLTVGGKKVKLTIWDTAGQERFRTLTSSYYRGAQAIILVFDVTRRDSFTNLSDVWAKEVELYSTNQECIKMLVGNKVDRESERLVSREEGASLAKDLGCLFRECSAKTRENVEQCFEELALKIMEMPSLLEEGSNMGKRNILKQKQEHQTPPSGGCCS
ncbi:Ras-related protein RABC2a [Abeliophyllum distichum]|uniref:Ras-related protein RABC2a n=1 Tax=Abeliophyllum distichum TaxID=126358 RepID=A0ABD1QYQ5_9LAMI